MKVLLESSFKVALLNFLINIFIILTSYLLEQNNIAIKGLSLFFLLSSITVFVISIQKVGEPHLYQFTYTILFTSLSIILLSFFTFGFSLLLHEYIDPNLRYQTAHESATSFYESIQRIEREQNVTFLFDYDKEVERIVASFEPINMFRAKVISTLISLVLYNFLVLLTVRGRSQEF